MNFLLINPENMQNNKVAITQAHQLSHLHHVLKVKRGDSLKVALLGGALGTARVGDIADKHIQLHDIKATTAPPKKLPITLILAMPRPKALRRLIMDSVSMGIKEIYLINSYRVEKSYWQSPHLQKLTQYMQLGLEQAGDCILPNIHIKKRFKPFVEDELNALIQDKTALLAHPSATHSLTSLQPQINVRNTSNGKSNNKEVVLVVGAEGGFIPYEVDMLTTHGCQPVKIYNRILRTETAVAVMVGQLLQ